MPCRAEVYARHQHRDLHNEEQAGIRARGFQEARWPHVHLQGLQGLRGQVFNLEFLL